MLRSSVSLACLSTALAAVQPLTWVTTTNCVANGLMSPVGSTSMDDELCRALLHTKRALEGNSASFNFNNAGGSSYPQGCSFKISTNYGYFKASTGVSCSSNIPCLCTSAPGPYYHSISSGTCEPGTLITSADECDAAVEFLTSLAITGHYAGNANKNAQGCTYRNGYSSYYVSSGTLQCSPTYPCVCRGDGISAPETPSPTPATQEPTTAPTASPTPATQEPTTAPTPAPTVATNEPTPATQEPTTATTPAPTVATNEPTPAPDNGGSISTESPTISTPEPTAAPDNGTSTESPTAGGGSPPNTIDIDLVFTDMTTAITGIESALGDLINPDDFTGDIATQVNNVLDDVADVFNSGLADANQIAVTLDTISTIGNDLADVVLAAGGGVITAGDGDVHVTGGMFPTFSAGTELSLGDNTKITINTDLGTNTTIVSWTAPVSVETTTGTQASDVVSVDIDTTTNPNTVGFDIDLVLSTTYADVTKFDYACHLMGPDPTATVTSPETCQATPNADGTVNCDCSLEQDASGGFSGSVMVSATLKEGGEDPGAECPISCESNSDCSCPSAPDGGICREKECFYDFDPTIIDLAPAFCSVPNALLLLPLLSL